MSHLTQTFVTIARLGLATIGLLGTAHALPATPPETDTLDRLFFSSKERAELDRIRIGIIDGEESGDSSRTVRLDGIMQRSGKPAVVWINGNRYHGRDVAGASIAPNALSASTLVVSMPAPDAHSTILKVGQTLDPAGGNLREVYQRPPQELNQLLQLLSKRGKTTSNASAMPNKQKAGTRLHPLLAGKPEKP